MPIASSLGSLGCVITSSLKSEVIPLLDKAIASVKQASRISKIDCQVVVVTTSAKEANELVSQPDYILRLPNYLGFGAQNNHAIDYLLLKHPKIKNVLLLNDDARIDKNFFKALANLPRANVYIPLIYQSGSMHDIDAFGMEVFLSGFASDSVDPSDETQWGTAACIVFSTRFIRKVISTFGMFFNHHLYFYFEDVELFVRSMSLSPSVVKSNTLIAHHYRSFTSGKKSDFNYSNTLLSYCKYVIISWPRKTMRRNWWRFLVIYNWLILKNIIDGKILMVAKVLFKLCAGLPRLITLRHQITSHYPINFDVSVYSKQYAFRTRKSRKLIAI